MSKSQPTAITAIHRADHESFAASTLFSQGWSVLHRALEWGSLIEFLDTSTSTPDVLLCSTDLVGYEPKLIEEIKSRGIKVFLFRSENQSLDQDPLAIAMPTTALELIGLVRGSIRSPMVRETPKENPKVRAKVLGITSAHCAAGCTTLAINLASELSASGKRTLLVDAHSHAPAVAILLGEQGLQSARGYQQLSTGFWAMEITQSNTVESIAALDIATYEFDFIVIDLGVTHDLAQLLSGRRWSGETLVWTVSSADELWVVAKSDLLSLERLRKLSQEFLRNSIKPELSFVHSHSHSGRRSTTADESFTSMVRALKPKKIIKVPLDSRSITSAEKSHETLYQSNERSLLRKRIQEIAGEMSG
jgi:MinD-like ATPase involved in chromosome partitioning or flagellar assembly